MTADPARAVDTLNRHFFLDFPLDAARKIEEIDTAEVVEAVKRQSAKTLAPVWRRLVPDTGAAVLQALPDQLSDRLLAELPPWEAVRILGQMEPDEKERRLSRLDSAIRKELEALLSYPADSAGHMMETRVPVFRREMTVRQALDRLRKAGVKAVRSLFLVDEMNRLTSQVSLSDVALAAPDTTLADLEKGVPASVRPVDPLQDVSNAFERYRILDLPVVTINDVLIGVITHDGLAQTFQMESTADLQTMVGASKEERALSSPAFTVRKRMPWLMVNLLTAFLAASVVGIFESTIAQVTALAVLLPVVAGQSGNSGAQALAVTMRGLALREITVRHWGYVMRKEVASGFMNGLAIAVACGVGVFIWSQSAGLVIVIALSMVLAMVAAGFAGAVIPIFLTRIGQDPATSSSIILTTVTDISGFFAFLGIATLLMQYL